MRGKAILMQNYLTATNTWGSSWKLLSVF